MIATAGCVTTRVVVVPPPEECPTEADVELLASELPHHRDSQKAVEQDRMVDRFLRAAAFCQVARGDE